MPKQFSTRPTDKTRSQLADLATGANSTLTAAQADAIDAKWRAEFEMPFNQACTEIGITDDREQFYRYWQIVRDFLSQRHTLDVWQTIHRCYEWQRDSADEANTLADAQI